MKNVTRFLSLAVVAVALSACACPSDYGDTPYDERTAGQGTYAYGQCDVEQRETRTMIRKAEPVLQQKARK